MRIALILLSALVVVAFVGEASAGKAVSDHESITFSTSGAPGNGGAMVRQVNHK